MCLHSHRHIGTTRRASTAPSLTPTFCWLSFHDQAGALAGAVQHLKDFTVHIRHPKFLGDGRVVEVEATKLVVAPCTVNGFARPVTIDPRQITYLHVYR